MPLGGPGFDDAAIGEHQHVVGEAHRVDEVVGDHDGDAGAICQYRPQQCPEPSGDIHIKCSKGSSNNRIRGSAASATGYRDPLCLAPRQLRRLTVRELSDLGRRHPPVHPLGLGPRRCCADGANAIFDRTLRCGNSPRPATTSPPPPMRRHHRTDIPKYTIAQRDPGTVVAGDQPGKHSQQSRLPRPLGPTTAVMLRREPVLNPTPAKYFVYPPQDP